MKHNPHTQTSFLYSSQFDDIDRFEAHIKAQLDAEVVQLEAGPAQISEQFFLLDDVALIHYGSNKALFDHYCFPDDYVLFGLTPPHGYAQCTWCGIEVAPDSIGIAHPGREYSGYNPSGYQLVDILVSEQWVLQHCEIDEQKWRASRIPEQAIFPLSSQRALQFRNSLYNLINHQATLDALGKNHELSILFREWLLDELQAILSNCFKVLPAKVNPKARHDIFQQAIRQIDTQTKEPLSTQILARRMGVSSRVLQYAFQEHLQVSPLQYILHKKLHEVKDALSLGRTSETSSVAQFATLYYLSHLGRFSVNYKKLFGESPSETLNKA